MTPVQELYFTLAPIGLGLAAAAWVWWTLRQERRWRARQRRDAP